MSIQVVKDWDAQYGHLMPPVWPPASLVSIVTNVKSSYSVQSCPTCQCRYSHETYRVAAGVVHRDICRCGAFNIRIDDDRSQLSGIRRFLFERPDYLLPVEPKVKTSLLFESIPVCDDDEEQRLAAYAAYQDMEL